MQQAASVAASCWHMPELAPAGPGDAVLCHAAASRAASEVSVLRQHPLPQRLKGALQLLQRHALLGALWVDCRSRWRGRQANTT